MMKRMACMMSYEHGKRRCLGVFMGKDGQRACGMFYGMNGCWRAHG